MFKLNTNHGSLNSFYIDTIHTQLYRSISIYPRLMVLRFDLHLPYIPEPNDLMGGDSPCHFLRCDNEVISRFFSSLRAKIHYSLQRKRNNGKRVHPCDPKYIWVREFGGNGKSHYHVALLVNKDVYAYPGHYGYYGNMDSLVNLIRSAWASALGGDYEDGFNLVYFPTNPYYHLNVNDYHGFDSLVNDVLYRLSYFSKDITKPYGDGYRCIGYSQY